VSFSRLVLAGLLLFAALSLAMELLRRNGVGLLEYLVGAALVAIVLIAALRMSRRGLRRA
jgi:chromate transport protein ChrA